MANKKRKRKQKICWSFSKWLAVLTTAFFFGVILYSLIAWTFLNRLPTAILNMIAVPFSTVTTSYFIKAGYENGKKIDKSNETTTE